MISAPTPNFLSGQHHPEGIQLNEYQETENDYQNNHEESAYQERDFQNDQATSIIIDEQKLSQM